MRPLRWQLAVLVAIAALALSARDATGLEEQSTRDATVLKLAQEFAAAFRSENPTPVHRLGQLLSDDLIQVRSIGTVVEGKEANLRLYREGIDEIREAFSTMTVRYHVSLLRSSAEDAVVFGRLVLEGRVKANDRPFKRELWETLVFRKHADQWKIILEHSTLVSSEAPKAP
jgi:ketosteroid isomerase-like protein